MQAIIMAGGKGRRLRPYTAILPKPLMPVSDLPILEIILRQLKFYGVNKIVLAVGYLSELLKAYFGDGRKWGIDITYSYEDKNLGTIGALTLIDNLEENFFVMNGDILTNINYQELMQTHLSGNSLCTIASYTKKVNIDLGVLETNKNNHLINYIEKPTLDYNVSMGIYAMNKKILEYMTYNEYLDIPQLMLQLIEQKVNPQIYKFSGLWLDIGRKEDYESAVDNFESNKNEFLLDE